jgi:O-acetylhomoserine (thiol)-lyase
MRPGDHIVASSKLYGGSISQMKETFPQFDWHVSYVDPRDPKNFAAAATERTKAFFCESVSNPDGIVADLEAIASEAHAIGVPLVVDNTLPTPVLCQPLKWGADIVVHSLTKYMGGQGNSIGGVIVEGGQFDWARDGKFPNMTEPCQAYHGLRFYETFGNLALTVRNKAIGLRDMGPCLSPMNAFLILQGIETLPLRMERHVANADRVAEWLENHPSVAWVSYPRLAANRTPLVDKYCPDGGGSVFTFGVKGGYEAGVKIVDSCELLSHVANIGDTRSLIIHPASTTHRQLTEEQQIAAGAGPDVVRLSIGIESVDDIIADLEQALKAAA